MHRSRGQGLATRFPGSACGTLPAKRGQLVDVEVDVDRVRDLLTSAGVAIEPVTEEDAELAGAMRALEGADCCRWVIAAVWPSPCGVPAPRSSPRTAPGLISTCRFDSALSRSRSLNGRLIATESRRRLGRGRRTRTIRLRDGSSVSPSRPPGGTCVARAPSRRPLRLELTRNLADHALVRHRSALSQVKA